MRPLRLEMQAFGPYAGTQEIDFRVLGDSRLFLITGPTGAGKSTILDAICYALYGTTSGKERDGRQMRSDFADPSVQTEVTLDFLLGSKCYRVWRSPEQERPHKRRSGTVTQHTEATLRRIPAPGEDPALEPEVIASQSTRVTDSVTDLLGFRADQFRQVIMLPQGQFRKMLTARSQDREDILEVLFQTGFYSQIEDALKSAAKDLATDMDRLESQSEVLLGQAEVGNRRELDRRCRKLEQQATRFEARLQRLRKKQEAARKKLEAARRQEERFAEHEEAGEALGELEARKPETELDKIRLERARKAAGLSGLEDHLNERLGEADERREHQAASKARLQDADEARKAAVSALSRENKKKQIRETTQKKLLKLDGLAGRIEALEEAAGRLAERSAEVVLLRARLKERKVRHTELKARVRALEKAGEKYGKDAAASGGLEERERRLEKEMLQRARLDDVRTELAKARKARTAKTKALKTVDGKIAGARANLGELEGRWKEAQAGILARGLKKGAPCPVCGSTEHPRPAELGDRVPEEAELLDHRNRLDFLYEERRTIQDRLSEERARASRLEADVRSIAEALGKRARLARRSIEASLNRVLKDLETARQAKVSMQETDRELRKTREAEKAAGEESESADHRLRSAREAQAAARATVRERSSGLPRQIRTAPALEEARRKTRRELETMTRAYQDAADRAAAAKEEYAAALADFKTASRTAKAAADKADKARKALDRRISRAGFPGREAFEEARLSDEEIEGLDRRLREFEGELKAASARAERAAKAVRGRKRPDLAPLEDRAGQAAAESDAMLTHLTEVRKELETALRSAEALDRIAGQRDKLEREYSVTGRIAEVANGKNPLKLTFQRFVLSAHLDDVLSAATDKLKIMSRSRFHLSRVRQRDDLRLAGGLDLEVYDAHTGKSRPVSTLSGGEGFLASLALALGLADVVQAYSGGIRLDTIFVDEGFGSLDPEALDLAIQALVDLQEGQRLVGIISHVPELKETIDVRLEVTSTNRGSSAEFVL